MKTINSPFDEDEVRLELDAADQEIAFLECKCMDLEAENKKLREALEAVKKETIQHDILELERRTTGDAIVPEWLSVETRVLCQKALEGKDE